MIRGIFLGVLLVVGMLEYEIVSVQDLKSAGTKIKSVVSDTALKIHEITK
tara:strand:+ start:3398 stop:3547 length:150 start_codon:yes stop_codon:yes gene_type:complete